MSLIIVGSLVLAIAAGAYGALRQRRMHVGRADVPAAIVGWATGLLATDRAEWGQAMEGELGQYHGPARWHYALGCAVAALGLPRRGGSGRWVVMSVLVAAIACAALVGYEFVRYPSMVTGAGTWLALATFAGALVGFVVVTGVVTRESRIGTTALVAGCVIAGVWIAVGVVALSAHSKASVFVLLALPLMSVAVGVVGARREQTRTAGLRTAVVSAVVASLVVFLVLAVNTMITGGRPYDSGQIQDFAASGYPDMATYAVSDNLGTAMVLLLFMSVTNTVFGSAGAALAARRARWASARSRSLVE
jgi:hypothetical protein